MLTLKVCHGKAYTLQSRYDKRHDLEGQSSRSRCHVVRLTGVRPIIRLERKDTETPKLVEWLPPLAIIHYQLQCQRSRSPGRLMLRPKVRHVFRNGRPTNFNLGTQMEHVDPYHRQAPCPPSVSPPNLKKVGKRMEQALSTAMASYKGLRSWVIARERGHTVSAAPGGHNNLYEFDFVHKAFAIITIIINKTSVNYISFCILLLLCRPLYRVYMLYILGIAKQRRDSVG